jgi:hypothetical protein
MTQRAVLAGFLVVVLAVIAVALLLSGGGGQQNGTITGEPFTGGRGITQSVASIKARQRYRDRHPEIERQRTARLAAQEAAREEAAPEGEEESAEEGKSAEGQESAEEGESAEGGESAEEGEAGGSEEEEPGEEGTEKTAGAQVDTAIREKPEPGEGSGKPKEPGPAARQQRVGSAAITPSQATTPSTSFLGAQSSESGFVPPDSMGSVGPSQVVVFVNGVFKVFDKGGNQAVTSISDAAFWAPVRNGSEPTDPGVEFDRLSQRWIVSGINTENTNNRIMLAISDGPVITSTSDFTFFSFNEAAPPPSASARFADYPQLGVDANAIYVGVNEFASATTGGFLGTSVFVIRKSSVLGAGPIVVTAFRNLISGGQGPTSPQPATDMVPSVGSGYVVGPDATFFSRLDLRRISDPGGTPSISPNITVTVPPTFAPTPFSVPAQGTNGGLDALDDRLFEAMIARDPNGTDTLWTAHNLLMNSAGVSGPGGDRAGARWYQLGSLATTPSLIQSGTLFDPAASSPRQFWVPSIAMNGQGHASLNGSAAGVTHHAEAVSSGRLFTDPLGATEPFQITQTSSSTYNLGSGMPRRWGDFSQTVIDPTDNMTFWTFQEYANATNSWGVRVVQLQAPPPATLTSSSPNTVSAGSCSQPVDITGTSSDGSGFFDPGSAYPSHITASVTGGVVVRGVTYTDPTHISLNLDTTGAASGAQDVTVTNPDGQSVTATGLVTVGAPVGGSITPCPTGTDPASPSNINSLSVLGTADAGSTVDVYTDPSCSGGPVATGSAADFASPGLAVPAVADDSTTSYYVTSTTGMTTSPCSSTLPGTSGFVIYVEDSTPPVPSINLGPTGPTNDPTPRFAFTAADAVGPVSFRCAFDSDALAACSGPGDTDVPADPLSDGPHTFHLEAEDAAGNVGNTSQTFSVDTVPPTVEILSGPTGTITDPRPTFTFTGDDTPNGTPTFACSIDTGSPNFRACSGPGNSDQPANPLANAAYAFRVRATDTAGNTSTASRLFAVSVPTPTPPPPPDTTITKGPKKTRKTRPKFKFTSTDPAARFECKVDKRAFAACQSPFKTPKLRPGKHTLKVRAVAAGGTDGTPAVRKFRVLPPG